MAKYEINVPNWLDKICTWPLMAWRKQKYGYTFRKIYLGDGVYTIVDADIYYRLGHLKWQPKANRGKFYVVRYAIIAPGQTKLLNLHREITNAPKGLIVDHINGNPQDNRIVNLRLVTQSQNSQNIPKRKNTSSRFIGVYFNKEQRKWRATISYKKKSFYLGDFKNEIDAAKAYDAAARKYYGPKARVNFPERSEALSVKRSGMPFRHLICVA